MKLESFSKEELIFWLRKNSFGWVTEDKIISDCLYERSHKLSEKLTRYMDKYLEVNEEYCELLKPYEGKQLSEIPTRIIHYGAGLESKMKRLQEDITKIKNEHSKIYEEYKRRNGMNNEQFNRLPD